VRSELGISSSAFLFLVFGEVRAHKEIARVLDAFAGLEGTEVVLVIAGMPKDAETTAALEEFAACDPRVRLKLEFIFPDAVAELFESADALIAPRTDGGTSGSLILGPSLGLPTIAADRPVYAELVEDGVTGWLFSGDAESLRAAMERAASDPTASAAMGSLALERMSARSWYEIARRTAALLEMSDAP
jgi:glycosyltransferase involved in cell wall biosynthesis